MHAVIINGSPRVKALSNTEKILDAFCEGLTEAGASFERYAVSDRNSWDMIRDAYEKNTEIIIAIPLYVECVPGLLLEFFDMLPAKDMDTRLSFILQGGFFEASQLRCGEEYLKILSGYLGVSYGRTLIKGGNFRLRMAEKSKLSKITAPYKRMGIAFANENGFSAATVRKFSGPEYFPYPVRIVLQIVLGTYIKKLFEEDSKNWGCKVPLDHRPWN